MADFEPLLNRWQTAGVLDAEAAARIRAYESQQTRPSGLRWQGMAALILGAILLACGVVLFVSAHWDRMGPGARFALVMAMVAVFHLGGAWARKSYRGLSTALHAAGTVSIGAAIALVGQIFNIQEHWPAAILLWAVAALAGWMLLGDEAQETLTLLLFPAWILSELAYAAQGHFGEFVVQGQFLTVWSVFYLTFFLHSRRKAVQGVTFAAAAVGLLVGTVLLLAGWRTWPGNQSSLSIWTQAWNWAAIALLPLFFSVFKLRKSFWAVAAAIAFSILLPWSNQTWSHFNRYGSYGSADPTLGSHLLVAAFCIFLIWWGVRQASRALVNLGIVGFAIVVVWFYFSDIFDKMGRSLGLIGLGVLFLAGGWALEKTRRRLVARMGRTDTAKLEGK